ncbi:MAG: TlpA family protein disulfide reductase [FCB group bacterium]|nr:TlpA family protein disulfide reductase [FCB group bacterium]
MKKDLLLILSIAAFIIASNLGVILAADYPDPETGTLAPTFSLLTVDGERVYLRDYCGELRQPWKEREKCPVILSFWNSTCQPCKDEIRELHRIAEEYGDKVKILLIAAGEDRETVRNCVTERGYTLETLVDQYLIVSGKYGNPQVVPKLALIDCEGIIRYFKKGYEEKNIKELEELIRGL